MSPPAAKCYDPCPNVDECQRRFDEIERRLGEQDGNWARVWEKVSDVSERLAGLEGRIAGYLVAASLLGTTVAFIAAYVFRK